MQNHGDSVGIERVPSSKILGKTNHAPFGGRFSVIQAPDKPEIKSWFKPRLTGLGSRRGGAILGLPVQHHVATPAKFLPWFLVPVLARPRPRPLARV
jgi:hypothetical protein